MMLASMADQIRMAAAEVVPYRPFPKQTGRLAITVDPREKSDRVVLAKNELVARVATRRRPCADPAP